VSVHASAVPHSNEDLFVLQCQGLDAGEEVGDEGSKRINEQASYAATKLRLLYDKLEYKRQALGSIQNAPKPDKKVTKREQI